jgi:hypothetical protein
MIDIMGYYLLYNYLYHGTDDNRSTLFCKRVDGISYRERYVELVFKTTKNTKKRY